MIFWLKNKIPKETSEWCSEHDAMLTLIYAWMNLGKLKRKKKTNRLFRRDGEKEQVRDQDD